MSTNTSVLFFLQDATLHNIQIVYFSIGVQFSKFSMYLGLNERRSGNHPFPLRRHLRLTERRGLMGKAELNVPYSRQLLWDD